MRRKRAFEKREGERGDADNGRRKRKWRRERREEGSDGGRERRKAEEREKREERKGDLTGCQETEEKTSIDKYIMTLYYFLQGLLQ